MRLVAHTRSLGREADPLRPTVDIVNDLLQAVAFDQVLHLLADRGIGSMQLIGEFNLPETLLVKNPQNLKLSQRDAPELELSHQNFLDQGAERHQP